MFEVEDLPKSHAEIEQAETGHGAANPAGGDHALQSIKSGFARRVEQKIIIAPVAQTEKTLWNPRQQREHNADFQAKNNVKNDA